MKVLWSLRWLTVVVVSSTLVWVLAQTRGPITVQHTPGVQYKHIAPTLIVSTLDGLLTAYEANAVGGTRWYFNSNIGPLLESTLDQVEIRDHSDGQSYRIIPSLDGHLYMYSDAFLKGLPMNADTLLASSHLLGSDVIAGGKDIRTFGVDLGTGKINYECGIGGCHHDPGNGSSEPAIVVTRTTQTVRAVDARTGEESWNLSVGKHKLLVVGDEYEDNYQQRVQGGEGRRCQYHSDQFDTQPGSALPPCSAEQQQDESEMEVDFNVIPPTGKIIAFERGNPANVLWETEIGQPIAQIWRVGNDAATGRSLVQELSLFDPTMVPALGQNAGNAVMAVHKREDREAMIYFGTFNHEKYVILTPEEAERMRLLANDHPLVPRDRQRVYLAASAEPASTDLIRLDSRMSGTRRRSTEIDERSQCPQCSGQQCDSAEVDRVVNAGTLDDDIGWYMYKHRSPGTRSERGAGARRIYGHLTGNAEGLSEMKEFLMLNWPIVMLGMLIVLLTAAVLVVFYRYVGLLDYAGPITPSVSFESSQQTSSSNPKTITASASVHSQASLTDDNASLKAEFVSRYLSDFEPLSCLGRGGFGTVFEARNKLDDCEYAVKRIAVANRPSAKEKVMREVKALAKLDHPGIVRYYQAWIELPPAGWQARMDRILLEKCGYVEESQTMPPSTSYPTSNLLPADPAVVSKVNKKFACLPLAQSAAGDSSSDSSTPSGSKFFVPGNATLVDVSWSDQGLSTSHDAAEFTVESNMMCCGDGPSTSSVDIVFDDNDNEVLKIQGDVAEASTSKRDVSIQPDAADQPGREADQAKEPMYLYIQMQLCQPQTLRHWLASHTEDRPDAIPWFYEIVEAVAYVHECGLIHRDLKPSNIFFSIGGQIRIGDFGLVTDSTEDAPPSDPVDHRQHAPLRRQHTDQVGTHLYMSPEQQRGTLYTHKVDVFALGLILFELLVPFHTQMERIRTLTDVRRHTFPPSFDQAHPHFHSLICRLTDTSPTKRLECEELLRELDQFAVRQEEVVGLRKRTRTTSIARERTK